MQPEMALGYDARTSLNAWRNAGSILGVFAAISVRPGANALGGGPEGFATAGALYGLLVALVLGLPAGILAAWRPNTWRDYLPMSLAMAGICIPNFVLGPVLVLVFATTAGVLTAAADPPPGEGWESLFNGRDLSGWKVPEGDNGHWKVAEGVIDYDARSEAKGDRNLWSEGSFGDFVLHVEWRFKQTIGLYNMPTVLPDGSYKTDSDGNVIRVPTPNADSGIFLRGAGKAQVNLWCWPGGSGELWGYRNDKSMPPAVRTGATPKLHADNPVGQWNPFVITMRGERVTIELNGKTVIESARLPGIPESGPLGLQHHGGLNKKTGQFSPASSLIQLRNIYIKKL